MVFLEKKQAIGFGIGLVLLCSLFFTILLPRLSEGTLWHIDECLAGERSREMILLRDYTTVHLYFEPSVNKPPLQYYLTTFSLRYLEDKELAVRIWSLAYATGSLALIALLYLELRPKQWIEALLATSFCATYTYFPFNARIGLLDMGLCFFILLTFLSFFKTKCNPYFWIWAGVAAGIGSLQKVPIPCVIFLGLIILKLISEPSRSWFRHPAVYTGIVVCISLSISWPILQWIRYPNEYFAMLQHEWHRLTTAGGSSKKHMFHINYIFSLLTKWSLFGTFALASIPAGLCWKPLRNNRCYQQLVITAGAYLFIISCFAPFNRHYMIPVIALISISGTWLITILFKQRRYLLHMVCLLMLAWNIAMAYPHFFRPTKDYSLQATLWHKTIALLQPNEKLCMVAQPLNYPSIESLFPAFVFFYGEVSVRSSKAFPKITSLKSLEKIPKGTAVRGVTVVGMENQIKTLLFPYQRITICDEYVSFTGIRASSPIEENLLSTK